MTMVQQNFHLSTQAQYPSLGFVTAQEIQNTINNKKKQRRNLDSGAFRPRVIISNIKTCRVLSTNRNIVVVVVVGVNTFM